MVVNVPGQQPLAWSGVALVPVGSPQELASTEEAAWTIWIQQCEAPKDVTDLGRYGVAVRGVALQPRALGHQRSTGLGWGKGGK